MATVQEEILQSFYAKLSKSATFDNTTIEALRAVLGPGKKLKADDVVAILARDPKDGAA